MVKKLLKMVGEIGQAGGENRTRRCLTNEIGFAMIVIQYGLVLVSTGRLKTVKLSVDCDHVKTQI